ncbi:hypothetical protein HGP28_11985 [Vibrio sp. SM6]|uniref:Uncharacterized protein n=1 Tax=Vibrio agarilyticus TaxID=2726741 RepID=A0A7X8YHQ7_9VIBR|nr:hypothetical protein [Vibrio agarilyticus]NLS13612.1 hypothetical protein [Vibrio agarilyticus]
MNTTQNTHSDEEYSLEDMMAGAVPAETPTTSRPTMLFSLRLSEEPTVISFVSNSFVKSAFHYLETPDLKGYFKCNGNGCVLCEAEIKRDYRFLTPVYNLFEQRMEVLAIPTANKPTSLLPLLKPLFGQAGLAISITKNGYQYSVSSKQLPTGLALDQDTIESFQQGLDTKSFALSDIYQTATNEEFEALPNIKTRLAFKRAA